MENDTNSNKIGWMALILVALSSFIIALDSTFMDVAITNLVVESPHNSICYTDNYYGLRSYNGFTHAFRR